MRKAQSFTLAELIEIQDFLSKVADTNEDTRFYSNQNSIVNSIIDLVNQKAETSVIEDFEIPFVHPMITIQKWHPEIKRIVDDLILTYHH
jgi:hypothetical protein